MAHEILEQMPGITLDKGSNRQPISTHLCELKKIGGPTSATDLFSLNNDALTYTFSFLTTSQLRQVTLLNKRYRFFVHKHLFSANRHSLNDCHYQTQLLKQWAHHPESILNNCEEWEIVLQKYFARPQTSKVNRVYALICLALIALTLKKEHTFALYFNLLIFHTEGSHIVLYASLYLIAQHNQNDKLKNHISTTLTKSFKVGFKYDDNNRHEKQYSDSFEELRSYSFNIIAQIINNSFPSYTECHQYALESTAVVADHFNHPDLQFETKVYIKRVLAFFPAATSDEIAAHHFCDILNRLLPALSASEQQYLKNAIHNQLLKAMQNFIETKPSKRFVSFTILFHAPIWFQSFISLLNDNELIEHQQYLLNLLKENPALDILCFCYQWLNLLRPSLNAVNADIVMQLDDTIKRYAIANINSRIGRATICLTTFMSIGACLRILNADTLNSQLDQYIQQQILLSNMKPIIMSKEFEFALAKIWQHLSHETHNLLMAEIMIVYAECHQKQKKSIALAISSIIHSLSEMEKIQWLTHFIKDGQHTVVDSEFLEFSEILTSICSNFMMRTNVNDVNTISNHLSNKLSSYELINASNVTDFYINLLIYWAINQQLSEALAERLTTQLIQALVTAMQSKRNPSSPRALRYYLEEILLYIQAITKIIPYLTAQQQFESIIKALQALLPIFEQKSNIKNVSFRPVLHAVLELIRSDKNILLDANNLSLASEMYIGINRCWPNDFSMLARNNAVKNTPTLSCQNEEDTLLKRARETVSAFILNRNNIHQDLLLAFNISNLKQSSKHQQEEQSLTQSENRDPDTLPKEFLGCTSTEQKVAYDNATEKSTSYSSSALIMNNQSPIFSRSTTTTSATKIAAPAKQHDLIASAITEEITPAGESPRTAERYKLDSRM